MTDKELSEIQAREQAATPGPWMTIGYHVMQFPAQMMVDEICNTERRIDADFIAHARTDIPFLLDRIAKVTAERDAAVSDLTELAHQAHYQPCQQCKYQGEYSTTHFCKRLDRLWKDSAPCPNKSYPYFEWRGVKESEVTE